MNGVTEADISYFESRFRRSTNFWQRALSVLHRLHEEEYLGKRTGLRKKFMEEVLPLAILARNLECPGRIVNCKYSGREHGRDATLNLTGRRFDDPDFVDVEIVSAQPAHAYLHREALRVNRIAFLGPKVSQSGSDHGKNKRIVSEPSAFDTATQKKENLELLSTAINRKSTMKDKKSSLLLINFLPELFLSDVEWNDLLADSRVLANSSGFSSVYISFVERAWTFRLAGNL